ncbi:MAG: hypothetical protein MUF75_07305 [Bacteroidia bacterium]|jgi:hypothetical protein|nr:hypothetical protein [Bacteroidia bacterium]
MKKFRLIITFVFISGSFSSIKSQCDTIASICAKHIISSYISDGQQYRSLLLNSEEYAEFHTTFFGETTYRIAACSGTSDGNLIFNIYDQDRHLLFSNRDQKNAPYWDFKVKSTLETIIEAQLDVTRNAGSGCAVILIGFKQK